MPDISNEDIMKLVNRVIHKVDTLEEKIDQILIELQGRAQQTKKVPIGKELVELDYDFRFSPIATEEEMEQVSHMIERDAKYRKKLLAHVASKGNFTLETLFKDELLFDYNLSGTNKKNKLEGSILFEQIYMYLKLRTGDSEEEIKKETAEKLTKIKNRVHKRRSLQQKRNQGSSHHQEKPQTVQERPCKMETAYEEVEEEAFEEDESSHDTEIFAQPGEVYLDEPILEEDVYEGYSADDYKPIDSDSELEFVTEKIRNDPLFLKRSRLQIVEESENGQCTLEQIFTAEFLQNYNLYGRHDNKKLVDLVPYKALFFFLNKHLGLSLKEIELNASNELKRLKNRMAARRKVKRRKGELPPLPKNDKN